MNCSKYILPIFSLVLVSVAYACQVPVFRYALERWPADQYQLVVLHDAPLGDDPQAVVQSLRDADHKSPVSANLNVETLSVKELKQGMMRTIWEKQGKPGQPLLVSLYPATALEVPDRLIEAVPLEQEVIESLIDSPIRQEIANRLVSGESAVWIFVPCGDAEQDKVALDTLKRVVEENEDSLELPEQEEVESEAELLERVEIDLRLDFSIVTLDRKDPKERFLLKMLLASEPDLEELDQPMAFPVLGRGRVLYALVGKGISDLTIGLASRFIIGPCSCQVKDQNPGFDLLMASDWDERIGKAKLSDPLPETTDEPVLLTIPPGRKSR